MENTSIFTKIINGEIPAHKIYEDDKTFVFLDINPLADGHVLVVPKVQVDQIWQLPDDYYAAVWSTAKKVAERMQEVLQPMRVGTVIEGLGVPNHGHVHLVPIYDEDVLRLHHGYPVNVDENNLKSLAEKLSFTD
ncbi:HIT family protein [Candidatus Saccharibacteria bacterium]|nr:HIT family protein [Candidatus Saccharibacteria bacterium]